MDRSQIQDKNCGDQKMIYSSYNRGDASQLPYGYAGKNFNVVSEQVMDEIAKANTKSKGRVCENDHYQRMYDSKKFNFFRDETELVTAPLRENFYCNAKGLSVDRIRIGCRILGAY